MAWEVHWGPGGVGHLRYNGSNTMPDIGRKPKYRIIRQGGDTRSPALTPEQLVALRAMAAEMAKQMIDELVTRGAIGNTIIYNGPGIAQNQRTGATEGYDPTINIDSRVIDIGASTEGLEKGDPSKPLAESASVVDKGLEGSKSKLRDILSKKGKQS